MGEFSEDIDGLVWRAGVLAQGYTDGDIKRAIGSGRLHRIWPGVYALASRERSLDELRRLRVTAAVRSCNHELVVSHVSAALLHDLPLLKPSYRRVHLSTGRAEGGRVEKWRHLHTGILSAGEVGVLDRLSGSRGVSRAQRALEVADSLSESVGESWSRAQMLVCPDIPEPTTLQRSFYDENGNFVARPDFDWEGRLAGEFDGLTKYGGGSMTCLTATARVSLSRVLHVTRGTKFCERELRGRKTRHETLSQ